MQLRADQLATHLTKTLAPLYVLHGDEPLLVIEAGDAIRRAAREKGYTEREVLVSGPGFKWDSLMLAAGNAYVDIVPLPPPGPPPPVGPPGI